jgi:excisionase family DNA binding protein
MVTDKKLLNIKEVAEYLGVHVSTVYRHVQKGSIPAFKLGSDWRFTKKHIDKWIDNKMGSN